MSCMVTPRLLALAWSIFTSTCGVSNLRSPSLKMKRPLSCASLLHLLEHLRELLVVGRRGDDELHRRAAGRARQRGVAERDDLSAGDAVHLRL